jgi:hypothetical protein
MNWRSEGISVRGPGSVAACHHAAGHKRQAEQMRFGRDLVFRPSPELKVAVSVVEIRTARLRLHSRRQCTPLDVSQRGREVLSGEAEVEAHYRAVIGRGVEHGPIRRFSVSRNATLSMSAHEMERRTQPTRDSTR